MKHTFQFVISFFILHLSLNAHAIIMDYESLQINFKDPIDAKQKATWSPAENIHVTETGLNLKGQYNSTDSGWIQTEPIALGLSWRPTWYAGVNIELQMNLQKNAKYVDSTALEYFRSSSFSPGRIYIRYSADSQNWSSWQEIPTQSVNKKPYQMLFKGEISIPDKEREEYIEYMKKYEKMDVAWADDEEALCEWILTQDRNFFKKYIPIVGYIQFLWEGEFYRGFRISGFKADVYYSLSGLHVLPKDENNPRYKNNIPWRFKSD